MQDGAPSIDSDGCFDDFDSGRLIVELTQPGGKIGHGLNQATRPAVVANPWIQGIVSHAVVGPNLKNPQTVKIRKEPVDEKVERLAGDPIEVACAGMAIADETQPGARECLAKEVFERSHGVVYRMVQEEGMQSRVTFGEARRHCWGATMILVGDGFSQALHQAKVLLEITA